MGNDRTAPRCWPVWLEVPLATETEQVLLFQVECSVHPCRALRLPSDDGLGARMGGIGNVAGRGTSARAGTMTSGSIMGTSSSSSLQLLPQDYNLELQTLGDILEVQTKGLPYQPIWGSVPSLPNPRVK